MRIEIHSTNPIALLSKIKKDINDHKIQTWDVVKDNNQNDYFTHNPEQWFKKALLESKTASSPSRLILTVTWFTKSIPNEYTKGLYIGRFTEQLLEHYSKDFSKLETFA